MRAVTIALLTVLCVPAASAQYQTVQLVRILNARALSGVVTDPNGGAVAGATVELCTPEWKSCSSKVVSGSDGRFAIIPEQKQQIYYLRASQYGFDPLLFKVHVRRFARKYLRVSLHIAS
jgi:hypothetical protein